MIKVLSFLSNENCFAGYSRGPCGTHVARWPRFENHWPTVTDLTSNSEGFPQKAAACVKYVFGSGIAFVVCIFLTI